MFAKDSVTMGGEQVPAPMYFPRAGNTVDSLRPVNGHLKSSEHLVTEGLTTKPEPVAEEVRSIPLEIATLPNPSIAAVETATQRASDVVKDTNGEFISRAEFVKLKEDFNDSMSEVANMLLDLQTGAATLEERIAKYNQRGGHRI
jgi:hypothetical protein